MNVKHLTHLWIPFPLRPFLLGELNMCERFDSQVPPPLTGGPSCITITVIPFHTSSSQLPFPATCRYSSLTQKRRSECWHMCGVLPLRVSAESYFEKFQELRLVRFFIDPLLHSEKIVFNSVATDYKPSVGSWLNRGKIVLLVVPPPSSPLPPPLPPPSDRITISVNQNYLCQKVRSALPNPEPCRISLPVALGKVPSYV